MLITFSGLDGAGKSTLISSLQVWLEEHGKRVTVLAMYDHVGVYASVRAVRDRLMGISSRTDGPPPGVDRLEEMHQRDATRGPVARRVYRVLRHPSTKKSVLLFDVILFRLYRFFIESVRGHVLILDRYFYDSLADVSTDRKSWDFARLALRVAPSPELPVFVDVPPEAAVLRKGEYKLDYMIARRTVYAKIFSFVSRPVFLKNDELETAISELRRITAERMR